MNVSSSSSYSAGQWQSLTDWFGSPLGCYLLERERALLEQLLKRRFGYHLLQLSCCEERLHDLSPMGHRFSFCSYPGFPTCHNAVAKGEAIPLGSETVDMVLLHHALDYSPDQHQLLREAARVLIAGGQMVIVGFNPFSYWGLRTRLPGRGRRGAPWNASLLSAHRLSDWLKLLDFQVELVRYDAHAWPVNSSRSIRYSRWMDPVAGRVNWPTGAIYTIVARKQVLPLTPVQKGWRGLSVPSLGLPVADKVVRPLSPEPQRNNGAKRNPAGLDSGCGPGS